jgi:hypothetical protein
MPPPDDNVRVGIHPGITNLRFILLASAGLSPALGSLAAFPFAALGAGDWSWPLGVLSAWLIFAGALVLGVSLGYGMIEWNPRLRTASLRRHAFSLRQRTVSIDLITEAWRSLSSASNAGYLVYRFASTDGATTRVLVQGRPMSGLDAQGLRDLAAFVGALPLEVPDAAGRAQRDGSGSRAGRDRDDGPALTDREQALAVSLTTGGGKSRVGRDTLLEELDNLLQAVAPPARTTARRPRGGIRALVATFRSERLDRAGQRDDAEALTILAANPSSAARIRRLLLRLLVGCMATGLVVLLAAVVLEAFDTGLLDADVNDVVALLFGCALLLSGAFYLAWCAASDADVRHRRRLARSWLAARDHDERERGMAEPFLAAWAEPDRRLRMALAFIVFLVGSTAIIAAVIVFIDEELPVLAAAGILVGGLVLEVLGVVLFVGTTRKRRADAQEMVSLGGQRLLPPGN